MRKMKIAGKAIISLLPILIMVTSCNSFLPTLKTQPTKAMETAMAFVGTAIAETQTAIPTTTSTATLIPSATPLPTFSPLPATETPTPIKTSLPISGNPTVIPINNGLTWSECVVPNNDYSRSDMGFLATCIEIPTRNENDKKMIGERVENQNGFSDWRIKIGNNYFTTKSDDLSKGCCSYQLLKNGSAILEMSPGFMTSDPNRGFWNIGGKLVWELGGYTSVIVVDGINYNEKYELEGSYFPYEIKGKLIYIAKKNGGFHIVYDEKIIGNEFDSISMPYCCSMISLYRGSGQYWFVGRREGTKFVVSIQ
jgi:hypothetical protein